MPSIGFYSHQIVSVAPLKRGGASVLPRVFVGRASSSKGKLNAARDLQNLRESFQKA
jgi:hypothetical protein